MMFLAGMNTLLADSDIWSDVLSLIVVLLLFGVPAIIRTLSERVTAKSKEQTEADKARIKAIQQKRHTLAEKTREKLMSDWDRRQQLIRERLEQLKHKQTAPGDQRPMPRPAPAAPEHENLPVAIAMPEHERPSPPPVPVERPRPPAPRVQQTPVIMRAAPPHRPAVSPLTKPKTHASATTRKVPHKVPGESTIERLIRTAGPLKAAVLLKEILDKPPALGSRSEYW